MFNINGIDYLQSQAETGKYGGNLIISTIGEGPKTFNPCNTKDATSASMAGILYDGLLTTHPMTATVNLILFSSKYLKIFAPNGLTSTWVLPHVGQEINVG